MFGSLKWNQNDMSKYESPRSYQQGNNARIRLLEEGEVIPMLKRESREEVGALVRAKVLALVGVGVCAQKNSGVGFWAEDGVG